MPSRNSWLGTCIGLWVHLSVCQWVLAQPMPYEGVVVESSPIRAGAGESFYVVGNVNQGDHVTVDEVIFGWYKIVSPPETFSYIARQEVQRHAADNTGTVTTSRAAIKAAGLGGPNESYRRQIYLLKDDTVQIVGEEGEYYKIIPPNGAYVFLPPGSVVPLGQEPRLAAPVSQAPPPPTDHALKQEAVDPAPEQAHAAPSQTPLEPIGPTAATSADSQTAAQPPREIPNLSESTKSLLARQSASTPAGSAPPSPSDPTPAPQRATSTTPAPPPPPTPETPTVSAPAPSSKIIAISPAVRAAEQRYDQAKVLPLEQQPLRTLLDEYLLLASNTSLPDIDQRIVASRVANLQRNLAIVTALRDINSAKENLSPSQELLAVGSSTLKGPGGVSRQYDAVGRLLASSVYNGTNLPLLFRVVELGQMRTLAYVRPGPIVVPAYYLERNVGIVGSSSFDPVLKMEVIDAQVIDLLDPKPAEQSNLQSQEQTVNAPNE